MKMFYWVAQKCKLKLAQQKRMQEISTRVDDYSNTVHAERSPSLPPPSLPPHTHINERKTFMLARICGTHTCSCIYLHVTKDFSIISMKIIFVVFVAKKTRLSM